MKAILIALSFIGTTAIIALAVLATNLIVQGSRDNSQNQLVIWSLLILTSALALCAVAILRKRRADRP